MQNRRVTRAAAVFVSLLAVSACAGDYSSDELVDVLTGDDYGLTDAQATCIVDAMETADIPLKRYSESSTQDDARIAQITVACVTGAPPS